MDHWVWLGLLALAMGATGLFSGLLAGLFGVGGGIVIVPVLFYILPLFDVPAATQRSLYCELASGHLAAHILRTVLHTSRLRHTANLRHSCHP